MDIGKNSRIYKFLRKIAGDDVSITPASVLEKCLDDIAAAIDGGGAEVISLTVDHNDIYEAPEGVGYSPVIVNVPTNGDYTTYIKTFNSPEAITLTADECHILNDVPLTISLGTQTITAKLSYDSEVSYMINGIGFWSLFWFVFGYWVVYLDGRSTTQVCYQYSAQGQISEYTFSGSVILRFYVTSEQKEALDALEG